MRYVFLMRNDTGGAIQMLSSLVEGPQAFPAALERYGGRFIDVQAVMGRYDAILIAEFDDPAGALSYSLAATAEGQYVEALPAMSPDDLSRADAIARDAARRFSEELAQAIEAATPPEADPSAEE